jgi:hypothetical protein
MVAAKKVEMKMAIPLKPKKMANLKIMVRVMKMTLKDTIQEKLLMAVEREVEQLTFTCKLSPLRCALI